MTIKEAQEAVDKWNKQYEARPPPPPPPPAPPPRVIART